MHETCDYWKKKTLRLDTHLAIWLLTVKQKYFIQLSIQQGPVVRSMY